MSTKLSKDKGWAGDRQRGAGMGRPSDASEPVGRCTCTHMPLRDGYDAGGAYWGCRDSRLYMIGDDANREKVVIDAISRASAMKDYEDRFPGLVRWKRPIKVPYDALVESILPGYIKCAMFSDVISCDEGEKGYDEPFDENHTFSDIGETAIDRMRADILEFINGNSAIVKEALEKDDYSADQLGNDLWYSRNGHGTGFFDRDGELGEELAEKLQEAARREGERHLFINHGRTILVE